MFYVVVHWNNTYSFHFKVGRGVRQVSSLSPDIFNCFLIFINTAIMNLNEQEVGCYVNKIWI